MTTISIEVSDGVAADLDELARRCSAVDSAGEGATSHGALDAPRLLAMLAEDAAMVIRRPGSWEGAGMGRVLGSHGYEV